MRDPWSCRARRAVPTAKERPSQVTTREGGAAGAGTTLARGGRRPIRVLLVDDHTVLRQAMRLLLDSQPELEVVGEAANGRDAVQLAETHAPDLVVIDVIMPGLNGVDATRQIRKRCPHTRVLVLSGYSDDEQVIEALRAGASGYLIKESDIGELVLALRAVVRGNYYFSSAFSQDERAEDLLLRARRSGPRSMYDKLTEREREVLQLVAEGNTNNGIAEQLVISPKTVEAHKAHIMTKLSARNSADLVRHAIRMGMVEVDAPADRRAS